MYQPKSADVVVEVVPWTDDHETEWEKGERPNAMLHGKVYVNGEPLEWATGVAFEAKGGDFATATIGIVVGSFAIRYGNMNERGEVAGDADPV